MVFLQDGKQYYVPKTFLALTKKRKFYNKAKPILMDLTKELGYKPKAVKPGSYTFKTKGLSGELFIYNQ